MRRIMRESSLMLILLLMANVTFAANAGVSPQQENYALLITNPRHIKVAVMTAKELFANSNFHTRHFEIVVCGKAVQALVSNNPLQPEIEQGIKLGISFKACHISLGKAQITTDQLIPGVVAVPNGLVRMFELEKDGYHTLEL